MSLHQVLHAIHVSAVWLNVPRAWVQRGFGSQICHFTVKPCCASSAQQSKSSKLQAQPGLPVLSPTSCFLIAPTCWFPSQGREMLLPINVTKLGIPTPTGLIVKAYKLPLLPLFFFFLKRNVWCKMDLLPPHNLSEHLMRAWGRGQCQQRQK